MVQFGQDVTPTRVPRPAPRASLREEQRALTRARVLDAAVTVFAEKSYGATTMEDIARAAGVTRVTVYAHFAGKQELLPALAQRLYAVTDELYGELAARPAWTRDVVRAWLETATARWREAQATLRVLTAMLPTVTGDAGTPPDHRQHVQDRYLQAHHRYVEMLAGTPGRWDVPPAEARQRCLLMVLQLESFLSLWVARDWPVETDDPLALLTDAVCHLLAPALRDPA
jgi:AcrR family transcriptional regulator